MRFSTFFWYNPLPLGQNTGVLSQKEEVRTMEKERSTNQTNNQNANQSKQCKDKKSGGQTTNQK